MYITNTLLVTGCKSFQWRSQRQNLTVKAKTKASTLKAWTLEAKAVGPKTKGKALKHSTIEEIKRRPTA